MAMSCLLVVFKKPILFVCIEVLRPSQPKETDLMMILDFTKHKRMMVICLEMEINAQTKHRSAKHEK